MTFERTHDYAEIVRLRREEPNLTNVDIARRVGCAPRTVNRALTDGPNPLPPRGPQPPKPIDPVLAEKARYLLEEEGQSYPMVHEQTGIPLKRLPKEFPGHQWSSAQTIEAVHMMSAVKRLPNTIQRRAA